MGPQSTIAHYRITAKLGEGGMGEVWQATDTKLKREVAIKVIPSTFADNPGRMVRFEREAQVLASLNHPNIAAIYGVEERALVMELVEGETLAGPLSVPQALPMVHQLIDALEWAHERGIVHRDLKPANIKVTPQGRIKVLDFGLAKAMTEPSVASDAASASTLPMATQAGAVLGTPAYMSPEQARGQKVDKRADIWAFGVVVHEMLTGRRLFSAESGSDTLVQVLTAEVEIPAAPHPFRGLLRRCLERDPRKRLRDIGDARALLEEPPPEPVSVPAARRAWPLMLSAALALIAVTFATLWLRTEPAPNAPLHFTIEARGGCYVSPDGRYILNTSPNGLSLRSMDNTAWRVLPETEAATFPFWAPDSTAIGFFSGGRLRISSVKGGSPRNVAAAPSPLGGAWRGGVDDGTILFSSANAFHVLDLASGQVKDLPLAFTAGQRPMDPAFFPEGDGFMYLVEAEEKASLFRSSLSTRNTTGETLLDTRRRAIFARHPRTGQWHLFYVSPDQQVAGAPGGTLFARPIHPRNGTFTGPPVRILDSLPRPVVARHGAFDVAQSGLITWQWTATSQPIWRIRWSDLKGVVTGAVGDLGMYVSLALAPDESKLAVLQGSPIEHIWLYNLQNGTAARLSSLPGNEGNPVWSPDSRTLYYTVGTETHQQVIRQEVTSGSQPEVVYESDGQRPPSIQDITPDGRYLIFSGRGQGPQSGILRLDVSPGVATRVLEQILPNGNASLVRISPDGRSLIFTGGGGSVLASRYPPSDEKPRQIGSFRGAAYPFFSRDGRTLFFIAERSVISHPVFPNPAGGIRLGERTVLFPITSGSRTVANVGAISRDGNRLLTIATEDDDELKTHVLSDWSTLLKN